MIIGNLNFLLNGEFTDLFKRFVKGGICVNFIIDPIEGAYFFNNPKIHKIL